MIRLEASTRREFHAAVSDAATAVGRAGGWVVSHQFYSNTLAVIAFRLPAAALKSLENAFGLAGIKLHQPVPEAPDKPDEIAVQLAITVVDGGPDVRREVPAFG
jgi:hypothetical protein